MGKKARYKRYIADKARARGYGELQAIGTIEGLIDEVVEDATLDLIAVVEVALRRKIDPVPRMRRLLRYWKTGR